MTTLRTFAAGVALLAMPLVLHAQESPPPGSQLKTVIVPLKVQVTFSEFDSDKKLSSLPYTLNHNADTSRETRTSMRVGIKVPIQTSPNQFQYQNLGTDIDCYVRGETGGAFRLTLELRRASLYTPGSDSRQIEWKPNDPAMPGTPFFREFTGRVDALLRDGQTTQTTMATDPVSGRILRVDVTLTVIK